MNHHRITRFIEIFSEWLEGEISGAVDALTIENWMLRQKFIRHAVHSAECLFNSPNEIDTCPCSCGLREWMASHGYEEDYDNQAPSWKRIDHDDHGWSPPNCREHEADM